MKVTLDKSDALRAETAAFHACGLLRLAANINPAARHYVFDEDSPVWEMLAEAETTLFNAAANLQFAVRRTETETETERGDGA